MSVNIGCLITAKPYQAIDKAIFEVISVTVYC